MPTKKFEAMRRDLSIYVSGPDALFVEVYYLAFPRYEGAFCTYSSIIPFQRELLDQALKAAERVCERFELDCRDDLTEAVVKKCFDREWSTSTIL